MIDLWGICVGNLILQTADFLTCLGSSAYLAYGDPLNRERNTDWRPWRPHLLIAPPNTEIMSWQSKTFPLNARVLRINM